MLRCNLSFYCCHIYQEIWTAPLGEILFCQQETDNHYDRSAVAIVKDGEVVGQRFHRSVLYFFCLEQ